MPLINSLLVITCHLAIGNYKYCIVVGFSSYYPKRAQMEYLACVCARAFACCVRECNCVRVCVYVCVFVCVCFVCVLSMCVYVCNIYIYVCVWRNCQRLHIVTAIANWLLSNVFSFFHRNRRDQQERYGRCVVAFHIEIVGYFSWLSREWIVVEQVALSQTITSL